MRVAQHRPHGRFCAVLTGGSAIFSEMKVNRTCNWFNYLNRGPPFHGGSSGTSDRTYEPDSSSFLQKRIARYRTGTFGADGCQFCTKNQFKLLNRFLVLKLKPVSTEKYPCCDDRRNRGTSWYWRVSILYRESVQIIEPIFGAQTEAVSTEKLRKYPCRLTIN